MASTINATTTGAGGIIYTADASGVLQLQANATNALTVEANAAITINNSLNVSGNIVSTRGTVTSLVSATAQATTSGSNIDFTGIPNWVKRVTILIKGVSTNGSSTPIIRLGTSGGFVATGYLSSGSSYGGSAGGSAAQYTTGFGLCGALGASSIFSGIMTIVNISGTVWVESISGSFNDAAYTASGGGYVDAGGTLTSVRLTTVNGTDTFDAGSINILYE